MPVIIHERAQERPIEWISALEAMRRLRFPGARAPALVSAKSNVSTACVARRA